jgi:hypothetical protein
MTHRVRVLELMVLSFAGLFAGFASAQVGTAFTYQGRLADNNVAATGAYVFRITPYSAASGGSPLAATQQTAPIALQDGVFTLTLDFGPAVFIGTPVWLEIAVDGPTTDFVTLSPRQPVTPAPYALHADNVAVGAVDSFALADGSVTAPKIASAAVGTAQVDQNAIQRRIASGCAAGQAIRTVAPDGGVTCEPIPPTGLWFESAGTARLATSATIVDTTPSTDLLSLETDSELAGAAHLRLREVLNDYARLRFSGNQGGGRFWDIAALTSNAGVNFDRMNLFHSVRGDLLTLSTDSAPRVGIATLNPQATLEVNGSARVNALAFAGTGTRDLRVEADGDLVAPAPVTEYLALGASDAVSVLGNDESVSRLAGAATLASSVGSDVLQVPVHLPHGARMTGLTVWLRDNSAAVDLEARLLSDPLATVGSAATLSSVLTSSGASTAVQELSTTLDTIVDNSANFYLLNISCSDWPGGVMEFAGARISYTR